MSDSIEAAYEEVLQILKSARNDGELSHARRRASEVLRWADRIRKKAEEIDQAVRQKRLEQSSIFEARHLRELD
jgi:hypothetical protein